ncbi:MAG: DUF4249 family protein [Saprospiraceae bacterium]|nr:DUF4249 family protein [Saprospiraceae bacterium]
MKWGFWMGSILLLSSCIDEIDLDLPAQQKQRKVIEGYVERNGQDYLFWADVSSTQGISGAPTGQKMQGDFSILYGDDEFSIIQDQLTKIPIVEFHDRYGGDPASVTFQLVAYVEGDRYLSKRQTLLPVPRADSLSVQLESRPFLTEVGNIISQTYVQLLVHTPLINAVGTPVSLTWSVTSTFEFVEGTRSNPNYQRKTCYAKNDIFTNDINIVATQDFPGSDAISDFEIAEVISDYRFSSANYFTVVQKSLTQASVEYWKEVKASNERSGNIYDVFPGRIRSNIINESNPAEAINGFFHASEVDTMRLRVTNTMAGRPVSKCALWVEPMFITADDPDPCLNCLMLANSTTSRPHYWQ